MTVLLLSGRGPEFKNQSYLDGSMFDPYWDINPDPARSLGRLSLSLLHYKDSAGTWQPLLRPKIESNSFLVTYILESILRGNWEEYESFHLEHLWREDAEPETTDPEMVLLSTTFICNRGALAQAIRWILQRYPAVPIILGGQYSNLKFTRILRDHPEVSFVVLGDGEIALPALLRAVRTGGNIGTIQNVVSRDDHGNPCVNCIDYINLETYPAPTFPGMHRVLPYESMRGCPFSCKFCSYPHASPQWRYKSASKVFYDWLKYAERNGVQHFQALDSTFTVPKQRLRQLLPMLEPASFTWEAYARANAIDGEPIVSALERAHCSALSIGFESMSAQTLGHMHKLVLVNENRRAHELLSASNIRYRVSFMVGYPGETVDDFAMTRKYVLQEFRGHFMLSVFSLTDETMPVWLDAERFKLKIDNQDDPEYSWSHVGMDSSEAMALQDELLHAARWSSDTAVLLLWQAKVETPLIPGMDRDASLRLEKTVERLAMLPVDFRTQREQQQLRAVALLQKLAREGIELIADRAKQHSPNEIIHTELHNELPT